MIQQIQSTQSFNGLLAPYKVFLGVRRTSRGGMYPFFRKVYHPFADESPEEVTAALDRLNIYENLKHFVGLKLPITKQEYRDIVAMKGKVPVSYSEMDCMTERKILPERLYRLWVKA